MSGERRRDRKHIPDGEGLESRALLNASVVSAPAALIHSARAARTTSTVITGVINGLFTNGTPAQVTSTAQTLNFTGQGSANLVGSGSLTGSVTLSHRASRRSSVDTYSNGQATLTSADPTLGSLTIFFNGSGTTNARGQFSATLRGTGNSSAGLSGPFVARLTGNAQGSFQATITVRV